MGVGQWDTIKGGFRTFDFEYTILTYGLGGGPGHVPTTLWWFWVHGRNTEASEQKMGRKLKTINNEVKLHAYTIRFV